MAFNALFVAGFGAKVIMDFGAGATWTGLGHFPEIIMAVAFNEMCRIETRLLKPVIAGFIVVRDNAFFINKVAGIEFGRVKTPLIYQQFPAPGDGFFFL